jgi:ribonuclease HII
MLPYYKINTLEVGCDEAGRGSLIGDVYAASVILPNEITFILNDSKKLSKRKRLILKDCIQEEAIDYAVDSVDNYRIDKINILNSSIEAMHKSLKKLNVQPEHIIVDGDHFNIYYDIYNNYVPHTCIINGDAKYNSIAAASILAKVYHDIHIENLCDKYPILNDYYDLKNNMGYGTLSHRNGIEKYGITKFHRITYKSSHNKKLINI